MIDASRLAAAFTLVAVLSAPLAGRAIADTGMSARVPWQASAMLRVVTPQPANVKAGSDAIERIVVAKGQKIVAGEVVAHLDTREIDREIAALKEQSRSVHRQVEAVRLEAESISILHGHKLVPREKVTALESQLGELERSLRQLSEALQQAEGRLARAVVRAPLSGFVTWVATWQDGKPIGAGETLLAISPDPERVVLEGFVHDDVKAALAQGREARISLGAQSVLMKQPLKVRLATLGDEATGFGRHPVRVELELRRSELPPPATLSPGDVVALHVRRDAAESVQDISNFIRRLVRPSALISASGE